MCQPHQLNVGDKVKAFAGDGSAGAICIRYHNETHLPPAIGKKEAGMNPR